VRRNVPGEDGRSGAKPRQARDSIVASGLSAQDLARLSASGLQVTTRTQGVIAPQVIRLRLPAGMSIAQARRTVQRINVNASADLDSYYYTDSGASGCVGSDCTPATLVGWTPDEAERCGPAPLIGLVDTGVDLGHDALRGQAIERLAGFTARENSSSQEHGTAIAALLIGRSGSRSPGLIPQARLVAVDAFYRDGGTADRTDVASLVAALEALADRGVRIINLSLSGPPNEVLRKAIEALHAKGVVLVAAAGNNGAGAEPSYPAAYPGVIAVTAVDARLNVYRRATRGRYVDLAAPGVEILTASPGPDGTRKSGTSYAVPFVSAAMALLHAAHPEAAAEALQRRLEEAAQDLGAPGRDTTFGYGLVRMARLCSAPEGPPPILKAEEHPADAAVPQNVTAGP